VGERRIEIAAPFLDEREWQALREPIQTGWLTQGPKVAAFEKAFAERHNVRHALACSNCTIGLHLMLGALGIGPGDEVIVPAFTWVATANAVLYCGAEPVFVDIDPVTFNIAPELIAAKITPRTRAIIAVHLFGLAADMDAIAAVAPGIHIVEDAACAVGAGYKGRCIGSLGLIAAFSFHPRKVITTGEGGMVTTNDDALAEWVRRARSHGASISEEQRHRGPQPYLLPSFDMVGFNYRMTDFQGAVGLVQLERLDTLIAERRKWADFYRQELADIPWLRTPVVPSGYEHSWQAYTCVVDEARAPMRRNEIMAKLEAQRIATRPGTHAVPTLGYYRKRYGYKTSDFPHAIASEQCSMSIPFHNRMSADDYARVVAALRNLS
jgi:perosamine synthetase